MVFDVLGTMVDEPGGLLAGIQRAAPHTPPDEARRLVDLWQEHVAREQRRIVEGDRAFVSSDTLDREAAERVAESAGLTNATAIAQLATVGRRLEPWEDSVAGLARISTQFAVLGLSNASRASLLRLDAHAGLRWHVALSAEDTQTYKPAVAVYQRAVDVAACAPERLLMVAAHAWDLRGAQAAGMRTAHVRRPVGDPPTPEDTFDLQVDSLDELATVLTRLTGAYPRHVPDVPAE